MAIAAKISSAEITAQVESRFVGRYLEARLINAAGTTYLPGTTDDAVFLGFEVPIGTGGYKRSVISYASGDVTDYADDGVGLQQRATVFAQNGGSTPIEFSHVALCWSDGNVLGLGSPGSAPSVGVDGTYTNVPMDSTNGDGNSLTVNITITNAGATPADYSVSIQEPGTNFIVGEVVTITNGTLAGLGATVPDTGDLSFQIASVTSDASAGDIFAVAQTTTTSTLSGGYEAVFYWNVKQFGFYSSSTQNPIVTP